MLLPTTNRLQEKAYFKMELSALTQVRCTVDREADKPSFGRRDTDSLVGANGLSALACGASAGDGR